MSHTQALYLLLSGAALGLLAGLLLPALLRGLWALLARVWPSRHLRFYPRQRRRGGRA
ncbi:hypothetical protein [Pseudomonas sp. NW5]|uniref:hypothetical protein n=1 Tax=Pseudomonas sp. NW5 TaxID=2934934 RepID=UPI002020D8D3|nr:hypothetical protein [Pseudomonas sp. NW5]MCL7462378.1 hypothetical protein [Pseudomonas sp. NW5]